MGKDDLKPYVAVKTHLDGDPHPRPGEVIEFNRIRKEHALDEMIVLILTPAPQPDPVDPSRLIFDAQRSVPDPREPFLPDFHTHGWVLCERDGEVVCEADEVNVVVIPYGSSSA